LLPSERGRGLGTVAVVCTMAGVASGLALATTLMAMQVAESMQMRPTIHVSTQLEPTVVETDNGFLGIYYGCEQGVCEVHGVLQNSPAFQVGLRAGDRVKLIDGDAIRTESELKNHVAGAQPGSQLELVIERDGVDQTVHPVLRARPARRS
jgi:S1-C subfamily serine protease